MKYSEFMTTLSKNPDKELVFEFQHGSIRRDYHITEVFSTSVKAIDCGGARESWEEAVFQLLEPGGQEPGRFMGVRKALDILEKSSRLIDLPPAGNVILEYRPEGAEAAQRYEVSALTAQTGKLLVQTAGTTTQCKAAGRDSAPGKEGQACCGPAAGKGKQGSACCG